MPCQNMIVSLICAIAENGVIGHQNTMPWRLPNEMKSFVALTTGRTVIMGRKTFQAIKRPLPNRVNVLITRQQDFRPEGCVIVHSLEEAIAYAQEQGETEAIVIGGEQIYREALNVSQKMYLTHIEGAFEGDTFFPQWDPEEWHKIGQEVHEIDEKHAHRFSICTYERI